MRTGGRSNSVLMGTFLSIIGIGRGLRISLEELKSLEELVMEFAEVRGHCIFRKGNLLGYCLMKARWMGSLLTNR